MNVSIRTKIFVTMIVFSLGPMLFTRTLMTNKFEEMTDTLSRRMHMELVSIVSSELEHNAVSLLNLLERSGHFLESSLFMAVFGAERYLDPSLHPSKERPVYASSFALVPMHGMSEPVQAGDTAYVMQTQSGMRSLPIDPGHPAFRLPHDTDDTAIRADQVQRLLNLEGVLKALFPSLKEYAAWINVGLESGVYMTYPGHGRFPMRYDHRAQEWYRSARDAKGDELTWHAPVIDPTRRIAVATASHPIRNARGEFVGAASIDVPMSAIVGSKMLMSRWSEDIQSFMVVPSSRNGSVRDELLIVAQQAYRPDGHRHWQSKIEREWLRSGDEEAFNAFLNVMEDHRSGSMFLPYKGENSVWAFASNDDYSFIVIVPESAVSQLPNEVTGALFWLVDQMRSISLIVSVVFFVLVALIAWIGSKLISRPLLTIAEKARRLAGGDFSVRIDKRTGDERDVLIKSFNDMVPKLKDHMRMSRDMELAHEVQTLLLPPDNPVLGGFDIAGGIAYCDQTGGDYYDFINVETGTGVDLGVVLGDVSGHGVPSALIMAEARGQLNALSSQPLSPGERMTTVNRLLAQDLDGTGRFITMFYMRLHEDSAAIRWVRAGHDPAIRYTPETDSFSGLNGEGLPLGVVGDYRYEDSGTVLQPDEVVVLATDGVWESRNDSGEMFGKERMLAIIRENAHNCAEDIRIAVMNAVAAYQSGDPADDMAVVVVKKV